VTLSDFNGQASVINFNSTGNTLKDDCAAAYKSYSSDTAGGYGVYYKPVEKCGQFYNMFFSAPDAAVLPVSALDPVTKNPEMYVFPTVVPISAPVVSYVNAGSWPALYAGTFSVLTQNFVGSYVLEIDTNGNGDYTDAVDVSVPFTAVDADTTRTYEWDGLDGNGDLVHGLDVAKAARVTLLTTDELHSVLDDVELSGGQQWEKLRGAGTLGLQALAWDDTLVANSSTPRLGTVLPSVTSAFSANNGVSSPTHSWGAAGANNYWGDNSLIDTWAFTDLSAFYDTTITLAVPRLTIYKSADVPLVNEPGDVVHYSFAVKNTGNVTVSDIVVAEGAFNGAGSLSAVTCPSSSLAKGVSMTCTATYTAQLADIVEGGGPW
jgi:hypothetical protein